MGKQIRIAVARIWHEGHSFNPHLTTLADFRRREWLLGPRAAETYRGTATEMGAVVAAADRDPMIDIHFLRCTSALPRGPVPQEDMDALHDEIVAALEGGDWDAVYVSLHGATLSTGSPSPDTDLLNRIRSAIGPDVPLGASFDMHACLDPRIAGLLDAMSGYQTYPHVDMFETGARVMSMLEKAIRQKRRPKVHIRPVAMLPLSHFMRTQSGPMAELVAYAAEQAARPGIHDATYFASFAYADTPFSSGFATLTADEEVDVAPILAQMEAQMLARREAFRAPTIPAAEGLDRALGMIAEGGIDRPVAIVDTADNPFSGGIGDTPGLLRAFLEKDIDLPAVFCFFHDPDLVAKAHGLGEGTAIETSLGAKWSRDYGAPVPFRGVVARLTDGRFRNEGPMEKGMPVDLGRTAVLQSGKLDIVIAESCHSANDPAWCTLHGIDLKRTSLFMVKAKNHFRAAFADLCSDIVDVETPGPAPSDLSSLPYRHVPRAFLT